MEGPAYLLDANVFIEAHRRYYAFDLAPRFWKNLVEHAENGRVQSIDRVKWELEKEEDPLVAWATGDFAHAFASTDEQKVIEAYRRVMEWVQNQARFADEEKAEFAAGADGWLVAYARVHGCVVVTQEVAAPLAKKPKIPDVCQAFTVSFIDTFEMLRQLGVRFA